MNSTWLAYRSYQAAGNHHRAAARAARLDPRARRAFPRRAARHHPPRRRLLLQPARRLRRARRQHGAHPRRQVLHPAAVQPDDRRRHRHLPMGDDPALGLGAPLLPACLPRELPAMERRRLSDPAGRDAALAALLLRLAEHGDRRALPALRQSARPPPISSPRRANMLMTLEMETIFRPGLHEFLTGFVARNNRLNDTLSADYHFGCSRCASRSATPPTTLRRARLVRRPAPAPHPFDNHAQKRPLLDASRRTASSTPPTYVDGFGNRVHLITHCKPYEELTIIRVGRGRDLRYAAACRRSRRDGKPARLPAPHAADRHVLGCHRRSDRRAAGRADARQAALSARGYRRSRRLCHRCDRSPPPAPSRRSKRGRGVCQDHAHIFIAATAQLAVPARYVTGYLHLGRAQRAVANHAWAEAYVGGLGWVGFDPANHICPTERYVRLACGFDAASAAPITGHAPRRRDEDADG